MCLHYNFQTILDIMNRTQNSMLVLTKFDCILTLELGGGVKIVKFVTFYCVSIYFALDYLKI